MKILLDFDDVTRVVQEVTNRAIEKNQHKGTIQKNLMYVLSLLDKIYFDPPSICGLTKDYKLFASGGVVNWETIKKLD